MASMYKRTKKSGQDVYVVRWYLGGRQSERTFRTKTEARQHIRHVEKQAADDKREKKARADKHGRGDMAVVVLAKRYIDESIKGREGKPPLEPATIATYSYFLDRYLLSAFEGILVSELERAKATTARDKIVASCPSRGTAKKVLNFARTVVTYGVQELGLRSDNPLDHVKIFQDGRARPVSKKVFSRKEMLAIFSAARDLRDHPNGATRKAWMSYYPLLLFLAYSGTRISEALGAQWEDFNPDLSLFSVRRKIHRYMPGIRSDNRVGRVKSAHVNRAGFVGG